MSSRALKGQPAFPTVVERGGLKPHGAPGGRLPGRAETGRRPARARAFIDAHIADDIGVAEMADAVELSLFHFARCFKRVTGVAPHRYLMSHRVERAKELLVETSLSLAEIAQSCGFAGQSRFTTAFKRHAGVTPGRWRHAVRH